MSTRANIVVKDKYDKLYFYRHSDGYPDGAMPVLKTFMKWLKEGRIRNNVGQASGWLIKLGSEEYKVGNEPGPLSDIYGWKAGSMEPTTCIHDDVEHVYVIDLEKKTLKHVTADKYKG